MSNNSILSVGQTKEIFNYLKDKIDSIKVMAPPEPRPMSQLTIADVISLVKAVYAGYVSVDDLKDVWSAGDTITIPLSEISKIGNAGFAVGEGDATFILADFEKDTLVTPINSHNKAVVTFLYRTPNGLTHVPISGNVYKWSNDVSRTWCNSNFYNAFDDTVKSQIKLVEKRSLLHDSHDSRFSEATQDYCWYISASEFSNSFEYKDNEGNITYQYLNDEKPTNISQGRTVYNRFIGFTYINGTPEFGGSNTGTWSWNETASGNNTYVAFSL